MRAKILEVRHVICESCGRAYVYDRSKGHGLTHCNSCVVNGRRFAVKKRAVDYKGGRCKTCGYAKCLRALGFHHRDAEGKEFSVSGNHSMRWDRLKAELDKCDLLCANCHAEEHDKNDGCVAASRYVAYSL